MKSPTKLCLLAVLLALTTAFTGLSEAEEITLYSGRGRPLVDQLIRNFEAESGIKVKVRYGETAEMAALILEEGSRSPADVYYGQDAGALGALAEAGRLRKLPDAILRRVEPRFRSPEGLWVGSSGRARVVIYNTELVEEKDLPESILGFTDPKWKSKIGWAPLNGSFQAFVTAMRVKLGDDATAQWLKGIQANNPKVYPKNSAIVAAAGTGEIEVGFVNHYYLFRFLDDQGKGFTATNYFLKDGDPGALINVAGAGVLDTSANVAAAESFVAYLLSDAAQRYFSSETKEYPLIEGIAADPLLAPLSDIDTPDMDLGRLSDLKGTLKLLQSVGVID